MEDFIQNLEVSLHKGFINKDYHKSGMFKPELLVNNAKDNKNVLNSLLEELDNSKSFFFSVAFITESGLAMLKSHFLEDRKSTRLNSSHVSISYAVFCLKKKNIRYIVISS